MPRPSTAEAEIAEELAVVRPALLPVYTGALPGARAAVLTRLWRGLTHEPLPWVTGREDTRPGMVLRLADGRRLEGPASDPYATDAPVTAVRLNGTEYDDPARLMTDLAVPHADSFAAELGHSAASLALSRAGQRDFGGPGDAAPERDWEWEQRVVDGHPFHPNCRSRPGFSVAEQLAYGPEHRPVVELGLVPVPAAECLVSGAWPDRLRDGDRLLVPVHPWQAAHVLKRAGEGVAPGGGEGAARAGGEGAVSVRGMGVLAAHPLMALRTLALPDGPHVKTAVSARLTSSVRDISLGSVAASAVLSDFGQAVAERTDGLLRITRTQAAVAAGSPDLTALVRESPEEYAGPGERVVPVAALAATDLPGSPARLARLARLALTVGLRLLDLGVALEAHGQNLLVVLSPDGEPVRLVYRDLADLRVSPARLARHGIPVPDVPDRMVTDDALALRRKLFGSLVAGALAGTAGSGTALRAALEKAVPDLPRTDDLSALRDGPLPAKALTLMRLSPGTTGDQWAELPNPLRFGPR
ncbi:IucA/IucC family siderophore biosynthesis protein [Actinospica acidiphila]|uniref:IucA/IucC family siderophore biosynthesis protein n=1 Tax=Actinospica acidiphila TaxID=304899 RepID=A0A9X5HAP6_9ACTN|nr:IucA/IucC family siderophore biosynthesis protein [Actinospica acidiphila]